MFQRKNLDPSTKIGIDPTLISAGAWFDKKDLGSDYLIDYMLTRKIFYS